MLKLKVYKKEKEDGKFSYYAPITSEYNGKKTTYYLSINFKKGMAIEDTRIIEIKDFFLSSYSINDKVMLKMVITDYDLVTKNEAVQDYNLEKEEYADLEI